jgi:putative hydrolase of the HAD superfamily
MAIKAVFFDAAGTLIKPSRRVGESYAILAQKYGMKVSSTELSERFRACFNASPPLAFPGATATNIVVLERDWWKDLVRRIFEPWSPFERFEDYFAELFHYFSQADSWRLYPEVPETLAALKARGLIVDVISNFDSRLVTILQGLDAIQWFDEVFISSRVGHAKPNRLIFEAALKKHGLKPENSVHVGDSEVNDVQGAINAGMTGILIDRNHNGDPRHPSRVSSLKEILDLLND